MKKLCIILLTISITGCLCAQKKGYPIDVRFNGGEENFVTFFANNVSIPENIKEDGLFGNSITRISVNPLGELTEITTINPIDSLVDKEVLRVVDLSRKLWKKSDKVSENQVFYIQIIFSRSDKLPNVLKISKTASEELKGLFPEPVVIEYDSKKPFRSNEELIKMANSALESEKYNEALTWYNELVKRDPFNRDLYKVRIMINVKLGNKDEVNKDDEKIFNFVDGYSLDDLNRNKED